MRRLAAACAFLLGMSGCLAPPEGDTELAVLGDAASRSGWDALLDRPETEGIRFGVKILGPSPFERDTLTPFAPASNTKLYTSAEALALLGPSYRFETRVRWTPDPQAPGVAHGLEILGEGDPTWGAPAHGETLTAPAERIAAALEARGVRVVRGLGVGSEDPRWDRLRLPQGWRPEDRTACYAALAQAVNLQWNCASFVVRGIGRGEWREPGVPVAVTLEIRAGSKTSLTVEAVDSDERPADRYVIRGTWAASSKPVAFELPVHRSEEWFRRLLARELERRGIAVTEETREVEGASVEFVLESAPLARILVPFMKDSVNLIGHALFAHMGSRFGSPVETDLLIASQGVMREFLSTLGAPTAALRGERAVRDFYSEHVALWDGSGISHDNRVSVEAMMTLLQDLSARGDFASLWESLPIAGVDGTLKSRMRGTAAQGVLRAKTGTLSGVYNLSGYVPHLLAGGGITEVVPFVVLTRSAPGKAGPARAAQDRVGARLAEIVNTGEYPGLYWPLPGLL